MTKLKNDLDIKTQNFKKYQYLLDLTLNKIFLKKIKENFPSINFEYDKYSNVLIFEELDKNCKFSDLTIGFGRTINLLSFIDFYQVSEEETNKAETKKEVLNNIYFNNEDILSFKIEKGEYEFCHDEETSQNLDYVIDKISRILENMRIVMPLEKNKKIKKELEEEF